MQRRMGRTRRRAALVAETAFLLPFCLLFLFAIFEYGRLLMLRQLLDNAAREGARYAVVHTYTGTDSDIQNQVDSFLGGQGAQLQGYDKTTSIQVFKVDPSTGNNLGAWTSAKFGDSIAVQITGTYKPLVPTFLLLPSSITLQGECIMTSEAN